MGTEQFAVVAIDPDRCGGQVQIPHISFGPAVHTGGALSTAMANGLKALVGLNLNPSFGSVLGNVLIGNFDSTKREIGYYIGFGHRRPPLDMFFLGRKNQYP
jgi:hypothetical protein